MLLELQDSDMSRIEILLQWANNNGIHLSLLDENMDLSYIPGKPYSEEEIQNIISKSRNSGTIELKDAHNLIYKNED